MWPWQVALAIGTVGALGLLVRALRHRARAHRAWGDAAAHLGTVGIRFDEDLQTLGGVLDGVTVGVSVQGHGGALHTRIAAMTDVPDGFVLRARSGDLKEIPDITGDAIAMTRIRQGADSSLYRLGAGGAKYQLRTEGEIKVRGANSIKSGN